jgi:hypothetical protein
VDPRVVEDERRSVEAEVAQVAALLTEDQTTHGGVDPVGPNKQIGLERAAVTQRDLHTLGGVVHGAQAGGEA